MYLHSQSAPRNRIHQRVSDWLTSLLYLDVNKHVNAIFKNFSFQSLSVRFDETSERKKPYSRRLLIEAQILRAGPSLIFIVEIRCSSRRSIRACPSISCDRNWAANSSQPEQTRRHGQPRDRDALKQPETASEPAADLEARRWTCRLRPRSTEQASQTGSWRPLVELSCQTEGHCALLESRSARRRTGMEKENNLPPLPPRRWTCLLSDWTLSCTNGDSRD